MAKTASLTSSLMTKKGQASPAVVPEGTSQETVKPTSSAMDYYKALTVKLDRDRYEALKRFGIKKDKKSQEIFVEALDLYLQQSAPQPA
jgi:hypothetical protein